MKSMSRRELFVGLPALGAIVSPLSSGTVPAQNASAGVRAQSAPPLLTQAHAFAYDRMHVRMMANGGESRDIVNGVLSTGEVVNLHQSMQPVGMLPNPLHSIRHSEFILVREGMLEFEREGAPPETVGPGGVIFVALGTVHSVKNVGTIPARYFVVAIGGDVK